MTVALGWWNETLANEIRVGLSWTVLLGFLRLTTHPSIFPRPLAPETALEHFGRYILIVSVIHRIYSIKTYF